ncbi:MAG: transposase family protein [Paludibacteraceae bacterium]|nr:transposase family protein [Paludibacteraceae bacterium]
MNQSLFYQAFGVREGFTYRSTDYKDCVITFHLVQNRPKKMICPHCGKEHVICNGTTHREIRNVPIGSKRTYLALRLQRYYCKDCKHSWQGDIHFTRGERSYTNKFARYVIDLMKLGLTM